MADDMTERERELITHIYHCVSLREKGDASKVAIRQLKKYFPRIFKIMKEITFEELFEILERHKDHPLYSEKIRDCISEEGRQFVKKMWQGIHEFQE